MELQTNRKIKILKSDNGGVYKSNPFLQLCRDEVIERYFTVRETLQRNGVTERFNHTLLEKIQCFLSNSGLTKTFWADAMTYGRHLINRLSSSAIGGKILIEMWSGKATSDYDMLCVFGCPAYYHVNDGKLEPRARNAMFLGYKRGVKGFKL